VNAAFKSMSDLLADAEDLLVRIGRSELREVRALTDIVQLSVSQMKAQLRRRARALRTPGRSTAPVIGNPWLNVAAGACVAFGIAASMRLSRRRRM
jgi:ElaB/YqjD/DUF883 family membrane-anchored ribosome-binding protein